MTNLKQNRNLNKLWTRSHPERNTFLHVEKVYAYRYKCIKMAGKTILPSNDTASIYTGKCTSVKQRTISHVSGLLEHEEFIAKVWHAFASVGERRSLIVDRESRSRTMPLRNTSTDCPTCTAVPVDFDFRLPRSLHPDVILSLTEFDRDMWILTNVKKF